MKYKLILLVAVIVISMVTVSCSAQDIGAGRVEKLCTSFFSIPVEIINDATDSSTNNKVFTEYFNQVMAKSATNCQEPDYMKNVIYRSFPAVVNGGKINIIMEKCTITPLKDLAEGEYSFTVNLTVTYEDYSVKKESITGRATVNEENKVIYFGINV